MVTIQKNKDKIQNFVNKFIPGALPSSKINTQQKTVIHVMIQD